MTLWDARTLRPAGELRGLSTTSQALAFSPDGRLLAAAEIGAPTDITAQTAARARVGRAPARPHRRCASR